MDTRKRYVRSVRMTVCLLATLALAGCGGSDNLSSAATTVSLAPAAVGLPTNGTEAFTATVIGATDQTVAWSVAEGTAGGTVTSTGVYTAPTAPGTYHVIATSSVNLTLFATATVTVTAPAQGTSIFLSPSSVALPVGSTQSFAATVSGAADQTVTWSVAEGTAGGTVTSAGVYTAPTTAGTYYVVATSSAGVTATASVTVF